MVERSYRIRVSLFPNEDISFFDFILFHLAKHTFVAVAATESLRVSKMKETKMCNVATVNWLIRAVGANLPLKKLIKFHPNDMLCCTDETADEFRRKFDIYMDSFTKKVSVGQLKSILDSMDDKVCDKTTTKFCHSVVLCGINFLNKSK